MEKQKMNNDRLSISLPFGETIRRSFLFVILNFNSFLKLIAFWLLLLVIFQAVYDSPALCSIQNENCNSRPELISLLLLSFFSLLVGSAYCRLVIKREENTRFLPSISLNDFRYIGMAFLVMLACIATAIIILIIAVSLFIPFYDAQDAGSLGTLLAILPIFASFIYLSRLYLTLPAAATGNHTLGIMGLFKLAQGNANKIFWGIIILSLPGTFLLLLAGVAYHLFSITDPVGNLIFAALVIIINFLDVCFKASLFSHIYQYLTYFYNKQVEDSEAAAAAKIKSEQA